MTSNFKIVSCGRVVDRFQQHTASNLGMTLHRQSESKLGKRAFEEIPQNRISPFTFLKNKNRVLEWFNSYRMTFQVELTAELAIQGEGQGQ